MDVDRRLLLLRGAAALGVLVLVPLIVVLSTLSDEAPIRAGEESPRTIETDRPLEIRAMKLPTKGAQDNPHAQ